MMLADLRFATSGFRNQEDKWPKPRDLSWPEVVAKLTPERPAVVEARDRRPAWSPATYPAGARRSNATALAVSLLVLDVDDGTEPERLLELWDGCAKVVHTTWSHQREKKGVVCARCRIVVPLTEPVPADQWDRVWRGAELYAAERGVTVDASVGSPSEIYFLPCLRDAEQPWWSASRDGDALDWRTLPEAPPKPSKALPPPKYDGPGLPLDGVEKRIAGMVRAKCDEIAQAESRHQALLTAARYIGGLCARYQVDPERFAPELVAAAGDSNDAARTCRDGLAYGAESPVDLPPDRPLPPREDLTALGAIRSTTNHEDPTQPGTSSAPPPKDWLAMLRESVESGDPKPLYAEPAVLLGIARPGVHAGDVEELLQRLPHTHRTALRRAGKALVAAERTARKERQVAELPLVVEHGQTWWVLEGDRYLAVDRTVAAIEVARLHKIDTTITTETGSRYMTPQELYGAHGVTARRVRWTYDSTGPAWDAQERILDVPGARVRQGRAERSELVEGWLDAFVAERQRGRFLDWLATCVRLDRPTSSPQFRGAPDSTGKAMLVAALATLLGGRTDYTHATSEFNAGLIFAPLVVLDEGVAESLPDAFRRLTGNREHQVTAKNRMPEELRGCPRVVVTSNEADPLRLGREELSSQSEHALGRRILVFDVQQDAAAYLEFIGGWDTTSGWTDPDGELVCHLRWLAETREVAPGRRFLVEGDAAEWVQSAHLRAGVAGDIVEAYRAYQDLVEEGRTTEVSDPQPFYFNDRDPDHVGLNVGGLQAHWTQLVGDRKVPSHQRLSAVLRRLSGQEQPIRPGGRDRGPRVYLVPVGRLKGGDG